MNSADQSHLVIVSSITVLAAAIGTQPTHLAAQKRDLFVLFHRRLGERMSILMVSVPVLVTRCGRTKVSFARIRSISPGGQAPDSSMRCMAMTVVDRQIVWTLLASPVYVVARLLLHKPSRVSRITFAVKLY